MRQHVNPLSKYFEEIEPIPPLEKIYKNPLLPLHIDIGCAAGDFLFDLAAQNKNWNYLGIEIREKLVKNASVKLLDKRIENLYFSYGNANNIVQNLSHKFPFDLLKSISFNFPDPWFKKKHHKRRVIQTKFVNYLSDSINSGSLILIKSDVKELYDYMEFTVLKSIKFKKLEIETFDYANTFNPTRITTLREKYANLNKLNIFEAIYVKI